MSRVAIATLLAEEMAKENVRIMMDNGYHINHTKDIAFLLTTLKSILLRFDQIEYPMENIIDDNMLFVDEEDEEIFED